MRIIALAIAFSLLTACTDPDSMRTALEAYGFTNISLESAHFTLKCGDDTLAMKFTAANPTGKYVSGVVCCGFTKACTVRF